MTVLAHCQGGPFCFSFKGTLPQGLYQDTQKHTKKTHTPVTYVTYTALPRLRMSSKDIGSKAITQRSRRLNLASNPPAEDDFHHGRPPLEPFWCLWEKTPIET